MRLFLLTSLTMIAFAANSVLNRMGLLQEGMTPTDFATIRLLSGALVLGALSIGLRGGIVFAGHRRIWAVGSLLLYVFGFSLAYAALDAGLGALILFGTVQVTMFAGAWMSGEPVPSSRWAGAALAFGGLCWLLWPGASGYTVSTWHAGLMILAGIGWGIYSLVGRQSEDALIATAANFLLAVPVGLVVVAMSPNALSFMDLLAGGIGLAVLSGAVTSGLGYALWYSLLPELKAGRAAVAQLSVPVIAIAGGFVFLREVPSISFLAAAGVVLGGVALSLRAK